MSRPRFSISWLTAVVVIGLLGLTACGGGAEAGSGGSSTTSGGASGEIVVFAAASLTAAFEELGRKFEERNPDAKVVFNFAGSNTLATQLVNGAPADVYASANRTQMRRVVDAGLVAGEAVVFAGNTLRIVVPEGNPGRVSGLEAFGRKRLDIAICAPKVPCGALAQKVFDIAGVRAEPDTFAQNVKAVLTKVALGEADAGLVYRTDVAAAADDVRGLSFPAAEEVSNDYTIAELEKASNPAGARAFIEFVLSPRGRRILSSYGFTTQAS